MPRRRRRRTRRRISLACLAGGLSIASLLMLAKPAEATGAIQYGYWWEGEPSGGHVPPPSTVPDNGLWVSANPSGPQAISAVRLQLDQGEENATLTLKVHQAEPPGSVPVVACPSTGAWKPVEAGAWSDRPQADCARGSVGGSTSSNGSEVTFALGPLAGPDGTVNAVLLPQAQPTPAGSSAPAVPSAPSPSSSMDASFEALSPSSVAASSPAPAGQQGGTDTSSGGEQSSAPSDQSLSGEPLGSSSVGNSAQVDVGPTALPASPGLAGALSQQSGAAGSSGSRSPAVGQPQLSPPMIVLSRTQREVLDVVLLLLLAVALGEPVVSLLPYRVAATRGKLSLYDDPSASDRRREGARSRDGRPPPLR